MQPPIQLYWKFLPTNRGRTTLETHRFGQISVAEYNGRCKSAGGATAWCGGADEEPARGFRWIRSSKSPRPLAAATPEEASERFFEAAKAVRRDVPANQALSAAGGTAHVGNALGGGRSHQAYFATSWPGSPASTTSASTAIRCSMPSSRTARATASPTSPSTTTGLSPTTAEPVLSPRGGANHTTCPPMHFRSEDARLGCARFHWGYSCRSSICRRAAARPTGAASPRPTTSMSSGRRHWPRRGSTSSMRCSSRIDAGLPLVEVFDVQIRGVWRASDPGLVHPAAGGEDGQRARW